MVSEVLSRHYFLIFKNLFILVLQNFNKMRYEIPVQWFPSTLLIAKEHAILSSLECPNCGQKTLKIVGQEALPPTTQLPELIGGDRLFCKCENCGHSSVVEFIFRKPRPGEDAFKYLDQVYTSLLESCSSKQVPDYDIFINELLMIMEDVRINKPDMIEQILEKLLNDLILFSSEMEMTTNISIFNRFKLISYFVSILPEKEFEWILKRVPEKVHNFLQALRQRA